MLVVKLEMHPGGNPDRAKEIGKVEIVSVSEHADVSDYAYEISADDSAIATGLVTSHPRSSGAWLLVARALYDALQEITAHGRSGSRP